MKDQLKFDPKSWDFLDSGKCVERDHDFLPNWITNKIEEGKAEAINTFLTPRPPMPEPMKLPSVPSTSEKSRLTTKKRVRSNIFTSDLDDLSTPGPSKKVKVSETLNMKKVTKKGEEESTSSSEDNEKVPYDDSETSDISEISNFKEKMELLQKKKNISQPIRTYSVSSFSSASESSHGIYQRGAGAEKKKKKIQDSTNKKRQQRKNTE